MKISILWIPFVNPRGDLNYWAVKKLLTFRKYNFFSLNWSSPSLRLMYSRWRFKKFFICSVILGQLESWVLQGLQHYFPENFSCNLKFYESDNFSDSSLHRILGSENFRFPFTKKNSLTWGVTGDKLNLRKS